MSADVRLQDGSTVFVPVFPVQPATCSAASQTGVLAYWMDAGWGDLITENKKDGSFSSELVDAMADMIALDWIPWQP